VKKKAKKQPAKKAKKKTAQKRAAVKTKIAGTKTIARKKPAAPKRQVRRVRRKSQSVDTAAFPPEEPVSRSGGQSGDLQGLSNLEGADSESVKELLEEGNAFEADAGREVHTHELPEDDISGEYLDEE